MLNKKILISGTSSGLGKFLFDEIKSVKFDRTQSTKIYQNKKWDCIIHCAGYAGNSLSETYEAIKTTFKLSILKCDKFIFISSMIIDDKNLSYYKISKIIGEKILINKKNLLILKLGSIIGKTMKQNTLSKIIKESKPSVGLSKKSLFSFVSFSEISFFIKKSLQYNYRGHYNFLRNDFITLELISKKLNKKVYFGKFNFKVIGGSNKKINKILKLKKISSLDIVLKESEEIQNN